MANSYVVTSITQQNGRTYLSGTVNGTPVNIDFIHAPFATLLAFETFVQPLMLAAVPGPITAVSSQFLTTFVV